LGKTCLIASMTFEDCLPLGQIILNLIHSCFFVFTVGSFIPGYLFGADI